MRKIFALILTLFLFSAFNPVYAVHIGTYKAQSEYGLIDGFKFNFFNRKEGEKIIQLKSETKEEIERLEREKNKPKEVQDEYQLFKFIHENTVAY